MYVRTLAWWQTAPVAPPTKDPPKVPKEPRTRLAVQQDEDEDFRPDLPEVEPEFQYLIAALFEAGPVSAGEGGKQLTWDDLAAWEGGTGMELRPWESRLLRRLSADYLRESRKAEKPGRPCPYPVVDAAPRLSEQVQAQRDAFRALAKL